MHGAFFLSVRHEFTYIFKLYHFHWSPGVVSASANVVKVASRFFSTNENMLSPARVYWVMRHLHKLWQSRLIKLEYRVMLQFSDISALLFGGRWGSHRSNMQSHTLSVHNSTVFAKVALDFLSSLNNLLSSLSLFCSFLLSSSHLCSICFFLPSFFILLFSPTIPLSLLLSALCHVGAGIMCSGCQLCSACLRSTPWPMVYLHKELNKLEEGLKLFLITIRLRDGNEYGDLVVK